MPNLTKKKTSLGVFSSQNTKTVKIGFLDLKHFSGSVTKQTDTCLCFSSKGAQLNITQLVFILPPHHLHHLLSVRALLYFMSCFCSNYRSPLTSSCSQSHPIVPAYRPASSILQCPDVLLSLRTSLHFAVLSYLRSISLLRSSFHCRKLRPIWPLCQFSLTFGWSG